MTGSVGFSRRALLGAGLLLPLGACDKNIFGPQRPPRVPERAERLFRLIQKTGTDNMLAPDALALMDVTNEGRYIPARQLVAEGNDGRYVVSLLTIRKVNEFMFHRRRGDVLILHLSGVRFNRLQSVRYPRNGKPTVITDTAYADDDFEQQLTFWFDRIPGR